MFTKPLTRAPWYVLIKSLFLAIGAELSPRSLRLNCMSKALRFQQITAKHQDFPFLTVFLTIKTSPQNISITLWRTDLLKLHEHRGDRIGEKSSCERFCKVPNAENYCWSKIGNGVISLLWQLRCLCNPDHDKFSSYYNYGDNFSKCLFMAT